MSNDSIAEAFRGLRSTVKFAEVDKSIRSVLVVDIDRNTSSQVARQLAEAFARGGDTCVYIDTDVRHSQATQPGLVDLIQNSVSVDDVAVPSDIDNLSVIEPGTKNQPESLTGSGFPTCLETLQHHYRYLILACASLPEWTDALALAASTDATILVITAGKTRRTKAIEARDALERIGANLLGIVMMEKKRRWF